MTPGRLLWLIRRDLDRGLKAAWHDHVTRPRIWRWSNPHAQKPTENVPIHILCGRDQLDLCAWMLASWGSATGRNWQIVLHDDGSLPSDAETRLCQLGLSVKVIFRAEADNHMAGLLSDFPAAANYRQQHPLALKIFDVPMLTKSDRFLLIDSDLLFFDTPSEILNWVDQTDDDRWFFNADVADASTITPDEAISLIGSGLWSRVNSGLCLLTKTGFNLDLCERALKESSIFSGNVWRVEQTLFALCATAHGRGGLLPSRYEVSLEAMRQPSAVCRHYVGAVRDHFYSEGIRELKRVLLSGKARPPCF
jgi:hypothetical protein